jgi:hypothetical protein
MGARRGSLVGEIATRVYFTLEMAVPLMRGDEVSFL